MERQMSRACRSVLGQTPPESKAQEQEAVRVSWGRKAPIAIHSGGSVWSGSWEGVPRSWAGESGLWDGPVGEGWWWGELSRGC